MNLTDRDRRLVQRLDEDGTVKTLGSLILKEGDDAWVSPRPDLRTQRDGIGEMDEVAKTTTATNFYWKRPVLYSYAELLSKVDTDSFPRVLLLPEQVPDIWQLNEDQLDGDLALPLNLDYSRKNLAKWKAKRDSTYELIRAVVEGKSLSYLLNDNQLDQKIVDHQAIAGIGKPALWCYVNRYIAAGAEIRGLLPLTRNSGAPGRPKFFSKPSGRATNAYNLGETEHRGYICSALDRANCRMGWTMFMKKEQDIRTAFDSFLKQFYAASVVYVSPTQVEVTLLPREKCPSIHQFQQHGQGFEFDRAPGIIGLSSRERKNNVDGYRGTAQTGIKNILQVGIIDSTSADQNLCSESSRLLMLSSPWCTTVLDAKTGYCLGDYTSFEKVSPRTHIAAVVHAATPKVAWCNSIGYELKEGEWHHGVIANVRSDNGEGKSFAATEALEEADVDMTFVEAWFARAKNICEADHLRKHRLVDWRIPGSTMGRMRQRGEKLSTDSPFNFTQFRHARIKAILHRNNLEQVPHLLTMEMRREGVEPTRRGIFEYLLLTDQIQRVSYDLESLYPDTLPLIDAQILQDGIHLWDPRVPSGHRRIPQLLYWDDWLLDEGYLQKAGKRPIETCVALDGAYVGRIYVKVDHRWRHVDLASQDSEKYRLSLVDWLSITDHDSVRHFLAGHQLSQSRASIGATIDHAAAQSRSERQGEIADKVTKKPSTKRSNTAEELRRQNASRLGVSPDFDESTSDPLREGAAISTFTAWSLPRGLRGHDLSSNDPLANVRALRRKKGTP